MILKKNIFLKSTILKNIFTQKITLCLLLPRNLRKFCVLRAFLKSTILKKKFFLKSTILKKNFFSKSTILNNFFCKKHGFEEKFFVKSMILNKIFSSCQILNQHFYNASDFKSTFFTTRQILNKLPKFTTSNFHIAFLHTSMYSYRLQYLRHLDKSIHLRSYNSFSTLFRKDFHF